MISVSFASVNSISQKRKYADDGIPPKKRRKTAPQRIWVNNLLPGKKARDKDEFSFVVVSYNVNEEVISCFKRIFATGPDIVCLQEVTCLKEAEKEFSERGYLGQSVSRVAEDVYSCTFWKKDRFVQSLTTPIQFLKETHSNDTSLVVSLIDNRRPPAGISAQFGAHLIIANVHLPKSYQKSKAKCIHLEKTFETISIHKKNNVGARIILTGDLNIVPKSLLYAFVERGRLAVNDIDWLEASGQREAECPAEADYVECPVENTHEVLAATGRYVKSKHLVKRHWFSPLQPVYSHKDITQKAFITSYTPTLRFKADYIFTNHAELLPCGRLELPMQMQIAEAGGFSSNAFPSDHIMLAARINYCINDASKSEAVSRPESQEDLGDELYFGSSEGEESTYFSESEPDSDPDFESSRNETKRIIELINQKRTKNVNQICQRVLEKEKLSNRDLGRISRAFNSIKQIVKRMNKSTKQMQHRVSRFGSQEMSLATRKSDLDVVLCPLYRKCVQPKRILRQLALQIDDMSDHSGSFLEVVEEIYTASTPIVIANYDGLSIDVSMRKGDDSSSRAVEYIRKTLKLHPLIRPFLLLVKEFAKRSYICDAFEGTCNSYCWVNIGIWFLRCQFGQNINICKNYNLGDLFILFFFKLSQVEFSKQALRSADGRTPLKPPNLRRNALVVLDPKAKNIRNLASSCRYHGLKKIEKRIKKMVKKLKKSDRINAKSSFGDLIS